jgi:hypothetical protein
MDNTGLSMPQIFSRLLNKGAARQVAQVFTRSNFSAFADGQFRCAGEKSRRIRAQKAPRGANSLNLRKISSRLGYLREQKSCRSDLPCSPLFTNILQALLREVAWQLYPIDAKKMQAATYLILRCAIKLDIPMAVIMVRR